MLIVEDRIIRKGTCSIGQTIKRKINGTRKLTFLFIAKTGRLEKQIIHSTSGFSLKLLRILVMDEADRIMKQVHNNTAISPGKTSKHSDSLF